MVLYYKKVIEDGIKYNKKYDIMTLLKKKLQEMVL